MKSADEVRLHPRALVQYSNARRKLDLELRRYLCRNLYFNPVVHRRKHYGAPRALMST
ncbi:MAG TPA: hypothetical protein VFR76_05030 [Verrucomicrobiae bacterium]|nr:hypothetical protein [Verrucomicrobiae bacterium]